MLGGGGWGGGVTYPKKMTSLFFKVRREKGKEENLRPADIFGPSDCHAEHYDAVLCYMMLYGSGISRWCQIQDVAVFSCPADDA